MPTILTSSQQTFVDITDQRKLSAYITSNLPKTQSEDPNTLPHAYAPNWGTSHLVLTPVIFLDQSNVALDASGLTISWKRKDGTGAETVLSTGETVSGGILTVSQNKLADSSSGMITYICYISYYDSETKNTVNISSDITYTLVKNAENARLAYVTADTYVFKYNTSSALVGATQATLSAQVQGVSISKWQYLNSSGVWTDYPTTSDNTSITGGTLVVKPAHAVFFNNVAQIRQSGVGISDVMELISYEEPYRFEDGEPFPKNAAGQYELRLENVSFRYPGASEDTLHNLNLTIQNGEKLAVVGRNGAGKSTLVKLLCGFFDPTDGCVLLNGEDIRKYNRKEYYRLFSAVFQDFSILPGTIAENVAQCVDEIDFSRVKAAVKDAGLEENIERLSEKYETKLGRKVHLDAYELSGGETQRLMLARALYRNAPVIVLDEPTAALDPIAESDLYERYHELTKGSTSIYVSHRLASTRFCDRIILIGAGGIAEMGTHEELMEAGKEYAHLYEVQSRYYTEGGMEDAAFDA